MSSFPFDELHHFSRWLKRTTNQLLIFISPDEASIDTSPDSRRPRVPHREVGRCGWDSWGFVHPIFIERFTGNIVR